MKLESLVIAGQLHRGEYVLESCTHNKSAQQVIKLSCSNRLVRWTSDRSRKIGHIREGMAGGSGSKSQPVIKNVIELWLGGEHSED